MTKKKQVNSLAPLVDMTFKLWLKYHAVLAHVCHNYSLTNHTKSFEYCIILLLLESYTKFVHQKHKYIFLTEHSLIYLLQAWINPSQTEIKQILRLQSSRFQKPNGNMNKQLALWQKYPKQPVRFKPTATVYTRV